MGAMPLRPSMPSPDLWENTKLSIYVVSLLAVGAVMGGFISGLAGFGTALFSLGWWLIVLPTQEAVTVVVIMSLIGGIQGLYEIRKEIRLRRLARFSVPALVGIPLGVYSLVLINLFVLKLIIGLLMVLFGGFSVLRRQAVKLPHSYPMIDIVVGFVSGILGGIAGLSGALPTMWTSLYDWKKHDRRAILQAFNMIILAVVFVFYFIAGMVTPAVLIASAIAFPFTLLGVQLGLYVYRRVNDEQFLLVIIWLILISGLVLISREFITYILSDPAVLTAP